ncbi:hypothetical protein, partial [Eisenbergiella massiliensis]
KRAKKSILRGGNMNKKLIRFLTDCMTEKKINCSMLAHLTGIDYQRILMIFLGEDTISGSELLCICRAMGVEQAALMALLEGAA